MIKKNLDRLERNKRRPAPIPYTRKGKTKKDVINRMMTKHKKGEANSSF